MFSYFFETSCKVAYRLLVAVFSLRRLQYQRKPDVVHAELRLFVGLFVGEGKRLVCHTWYNVSFQ